jgi:hypothetical protein
MEESDQLTGLEVDHSSKVFGCDFIFVGFLFCI